MEMKKKLAALFAQKWFTCLVLVAGGLGLGLLSLAFAVTAERKVMLISYLERPLLMTLNLLPPVLLCLLLWLLTNRAIVAYGLSAAVTFGLTLANWYKLQFRNDPLMFEDLLLAKEAGNMLGRYSLFITPFLVIAIACVLAGGVVIFFCARGRFRPGWPRFALAGALLGAMIPLASLYASNDIYNNKTQNFDHANRWSATEVYTSKGFLYPFLHSIADAVEQPPQGYSKAAAQAVLARYQDQAIPENKQVDVIAIMLEAFNDFSKYDSVQLAQDPYKEYHELEAESFTGNLVTNIFAGGTVLTERSFVTGYGELGSFRSPTNSYAWYLKSQGYQTTGSHPCYNWFYNRANINPNLGLDSYLFFENHYGELALGAIARDNLLLPELTSLYQQAKARSQAPYFSFSVTYQGHGPYNTQGNDWGVNFVKPGIYSQESENILNNYLGSIQSTSKQLASFIDSYREMDRPVIIVLFGDHNPWLGDGNSVYKELGIDLALDQEEGFRNYYSTRYLIWANEAAKEVTGGDFTGEGPEIAPCFLMNQVFGLCGWEGPAYMQYTQELMKKLPVIHDNGACITAEGAFVPQPEGELAEAILEFQQVEYYMRHEFQYQELVEKEKR